MQNSTPMWTTKKPFKVQLYTFCGKRPVSSAKKTDIFFSIAYSSNPPGTGCSVEHFAAAKKGWRVLQSAFALLSFLI